MNRPFILFPFFILCFFVARGQSPLRKSELAPARGHYKQLSLFDPAPVAGNEEVDAKRFPHDPSTTERRLGNDRVYLQDVRMEDFRIPDPPANSSGYARAELNYLLTLQNERTKLDVESSLYMAGVFYNVRVTPQDPNYQQYRRNLFHIGRSIGTWFNPDNLPLTADLMANVWKDASYFIWSLKFKYLRVRPYTLEPALDNLEETDWAAYPSGHAANSYINAFIFQELAPEFSDMFIKDAYDMAHSREIIGVHYPSDSEASRILARQFVNKLFTNEKFLTHFAAVKSEWEQKARERFDRPQTTPGPTTDAPSRSCSTSPSRCKVEE